MVHSKLLPLGACHFKENISKEPNLDQTERNALEKSYKEYAKCMFTDSLITGFPQIVSSTTWKKKFWKSVVFIVCMAGFLYQAQEFMAYYWTFQTTTHFEVLRPYEVLQPAITFCSNNRFRRQGFCEMFPDLCYNNDNETSFCDLYPNYCKYNTSSESKYTKIPTRFSFMHNVALNDWETADRIGPTQSMIESCEKVYVGGRTSNCSIRKFPIAIRDNPAYCYTVESQLGQPESKDAILPNYFYFKIKLSTFPTEYLRYMDEVFLYAMVHNRRHLLNPQKKGIILKGGFDYKIHVSMTCIEHCKVEILRPKKLCVDAFTSYAPHTEKICNIISRQTTTYEMSKSCSSECQLACLEQDYEVEYEKNDQETKVIE